MVESYDLNQLAIRTADDILDNGSNENVEKLVDDFVSKNAF